MANTRVTSRQLSPSNMTDVFERLHKLKGKTHEEIVAGSAHAEWATTDLFVQNTGRQGTGKLAEIVLAKCGQSQEDTATPQA